MKVIYSGRKTGRTQHLINLTAEAEKNGDLAYIVCRSIDEANRIMQRASEQGLVIRFPLTFNDFLHNRGGIHPFKPVRIFIDNADDLLQNFSMVPIEAITLKKHDDDA